VNRSNQSNLGVCAFIVKQFINGFLEESANGRNSIQYDAQIPSSWYLPVIGLNRVSHELFLMRPQETAVGNAIKDGLGG
jgi:hypothetical protein